MSAFLAALDAIVPHFKVKGPMLALAQGHPFHRVEIDLRQVASHKMPNQTTLRLRLLRGRWQDYALKGFRSREVSAVQALLTEWAARNHQPADS